MSADALDLNPGLIRTRQWSVRASNNLARSLLPSQDLIQTAVIATWKYLDFSCQPQNIDDDISGLSCFCRIQSPENLREEKSDKLSRYH